MGYLRWAATQVSPPGQEKEIASSGSGDGRAAGADSATVESDKRRPPPPPPSKGAAPGSPSRRAPLESCGVAKDLTSSNPQRASIRSHLS